MTGNEIRNMLEEAISGLCPNKTCYAEGFLQVSGIKMTALVTDDNSGNRIQTLQTLCSIDDDENYCDLESEKVYNLALPSFLASNVHRRKTNLSKVVRDRQIGIADHVCLKNYIEERQTVSPKIEGRMVINYQDTTIKSTERQTDCSTCYADILRAVADCMNAGDIGW